MVTGQHGGQRSGNLGGQLGGQQRSGKLGGQPGGLYSAELGVACNSRWATELSVRGCLFVNFDCVELGRVGRLSAGLCR